MYSSINTSRPSLYWNKNHEIEISCPVCKYLFRDFEDFKSFKEHNACTECVDTYYYPNSDKWDNGWRPTLELKNE